MHRDGGLFKLGRTYKDAAPGTVHGREYAQGEDQRGAGAGSLAYSVSGGKPSALVICAMTSYSRWSSFESEAASRTSTSYRRLESSEPAGCASEKSSREPPAGC